MAKQIPPLLVVMSPAEAALLLAIRDAALPLAIAGKCKRSEVVDSICDVIETAIKDAAGERPGSWEAEIGRLVFRNAVPDAEI